MLWPVCMMTHESDECCWIFSIEHQASKSETSRCIGQHENIAATITKAQEDGQQSYTDHDIKRKDAGTLLMNQVRANGPLVTLLGGLPLSSVGIKKQTKAQGMNVPFTLLFSFQSFVSYIKFPGSAIASLMQDTGLDAEAKDIVRAMLLMKSENETAANAKARARR